MSASLHALPVAAQLFVIAVASYLIGSIPNAYLIVRFVSRTDITAHGTGNVGAMNVRRTTGSWGWFVVAMVADAAKGFVPAMLAKWIMLGTTWSAAMAPWSYTLADPQRAWSLARLDWTASPELLIPMVAVCGAVLGHNFSVWMALIQRKFGRTGKGLATGGGALLAYDWRYCLVVVVVGLLTIAVTRYMMAGQVAAAAALPAYALGTGQPDWPFALLMGLIVYAAHHKRFIGLLRGREPKFYIEDGAGPRG